RRRIARPHTIGSRRCFSAPLASPENGSRRLRPRRRGWRRRGGGVRPNPRDGVRRRGRGRSARRALLVCGIASSLLYVAMTVIVPMRWPAYQSASQTISELSAVDAPTRPIWVPLGVAYSLLVAAVGWGVR